MALILALGVAGACAAIFLWRALEAPGPLGSTRVLVVAKGTGVDQVSRQLSESGVISGPLAFVSAARLSGVGGRLKAGEYEFPAGVSARAVLDLLVAGKTMVRKLTVPEGLTTAQIVGLVAQADGLDGELPERPPGEGELLPDTYHYSFGDGRAAVIERMKSAMQRALAEQWERRAPDLPLVTPYQALVLASIVEKETGIGAERARVAAVFINRLRRGMKLDADPTVIYALTRGAAPLERELTRADLALDDPYNTYRHAGLPPGPIANPGRAALGAALAPAATDELYFVADGSGGHVFARTLEEHSRNVAKWRGIQRTKAN
ncbi:MAG: endolytic transglycosylase MltG [Alphaproteobacteria bacterium]